MKKILKNFEVNSSKLKYPEHAVVIMGTKCIIVGRLNEAHPLLIQSCTHFYLFGENLKEFWKNMI